MELPIVRNVIKKSIIIGLFLICVMSITSCSAAKPQIKEQRRFWGSKEQCVTFLQSDKAVTERWMLEALGGD